MIWESAFKGTGIVSPWAGDVQRFLSFLEYIVSSNINEHTEGVEGESTVRVEGPLCGVPVHKFLAAERRFYRARDRWACKRMEWSREDREAWAAVRFDWERADDLRAVERRAWLDAAFASRPTAPQEATEIPSSSAACPAPRTDGPGAPRAPRWADMADDDSDCEEVMVEVVLESQRASGATAEATPPQPEPQSDSDAGGEVWLDEGPVVPADPMPYPPETDRSEIGRAFSRQILLELVRTTAPLIGVSEVVHAPGDKGNTFIWNHHSDKPAPHIRRQELPFPVRAWKAGRKGWQTYQRMAPEIVRSGSVAPTRHGAFCDLLHWLARRALLEKFESAERLDPERLSPWVNTHGDWWYFRCTGHGDFRERPPPREHVWGFHSTSPYCIWKAMSQGRLQNGFAELDRGGKTYRGVFFHDRHWLHACLNTYAHYVGLRDGYVWSPLIVLEAGTVCYRDNGTVLPTSIPCRSGAAQQRITYEDNNRIAGVIFHILHAQDVYRSEPNAEIQAEARFLPKLELHPQDSWAAIRYKARVLFKSKFWV